ncbi:MAG: TraB domain-containing protein, partial [Promethearchaeota archaeon]
KGPKGLKEVSHETVKKQAGYHLKSISKLNDVEKQKTEVFFDILQHIQREVGESLGMIPGMEMISAINAVRQHGIKIKLIDRPIMETFQRLNQLKDSAREEKSEFIQMLKENPINTEESEIYDLIEDFKKPGFIKQLIKEFKETYPHLNKILIDERNEYMADQIAKYVFEHPSHRILVIVGAGHLEELMRLTKENLLKSKNI